MVADVYASRRGVNRPAAKMTARKVRVMQKLATMRELAAFFRVALSTTHRITSRKHWSHVE